MPAWTDSRRLRAVQSPVIPVIADLIRTHPGTISLGQGVVGYAPPKEAQEAVARFWGEPANHKYQPVDGVPALVEALAETLVREHGVQAGPGRPSRIMVTAGGNNAFLAALLAIADPGDEVILPVPYYFNHEMAVTMAGCRPVLVPTDGNYQIDPAALTAAITPRTRALVTVSPNNPTGAVYPEEALRAVNARCAEHGIFHLCDEAYAAFTYDGAAHFSPAAIAGAAPHTIALHSLSKAYGLASWRIGWLVYPPALEEALRKVQDTIVICPPAISQFAALGALAAGAAFVRAQRPALVAARALVQGALAPLVADGVIEVPPAAGAFYYLVRVRSSLPPLELAERLIREHGVATIPGNAFGCGSGCHLRVAYGALAPATGAEGLARLARGLRALAG